MRWLYDDDLLEGAVFIRARSRSHAPEPLQVRRFHRERERLYLILDPEERNTAFFKLHLEWFREWGIERWLIHRVDEFPLLRKTLDTLAFRRARAKNQEGAELFVHPVNGRSAVVALRIERFDQGEQLELFLRHELMHLHDMVDPGFGYSPEFHLPGQNAAQQRLTRERYRLLWDIAIDGRLTAANEARQATAGPLGYDRHRADFERAFGFWPQSKRDARFASLWTNPNPRHAELLAIASDPRLVRTAPEPVPGAPCPLCGFASFDWADLKQDAPETVARIRAEFPQWTSEQGACGRCVEIYSRLCAPSAPSV